MRRIACPCDKYQILFNKVVERCQFIFIKVILG